MIAVNPMHMPSQYLWINLKGSLVVEITRDKFIEMLKNNFIFGRESKGIGVGWGCLGGKFGDGHRKSERWLYLLGFAIESKFELRPVHCLLV